MTQTNLFAGGNKVLCEDAADVNDDGSVDILDATALLSFLFLGGRAPPETSPGKMQIDTTPDKLDCSRYP